MAKVHLLLLFVFLSVWMVTSAYRYLGCYADKSDRILQVDEFISNSMTIEKCVQACSIKGYHFAGAALTTCFCGNRLERDEKLDDSLCYWLCTGNSEQYCGANWKISVYTTDIYIGCYADAEDRILEGPSTSSAQMTTEFCLTYCKDAGVRFALTEFGDYCFCGNLLKDSEKRDDGECDYDCAMNNGEKCGGYWRGSLYLVP